MNVKFSPLLQKKLIEINRKDKKLSDKIRKQIQIFQSNPKHPSLRLHKLSGSYSNVWSISVGMSQRMVYRQIDDNTA